MEKKSLLKSSRKSCKINRLHLSSREKTLAIVVLAALLLGAWIPERIIVSTSPSLDHRIFFLTNAKQNIQLGDYLVFRHKDFGFVHKGLNQENDRLVKRVSCIPGDTLSVNAERMFFCNQRALGEALETDSKGRPLPTFHFSGQVPEKNYFLMGTNPRSFDSRYFGFVHADNILYKALPLW